MYYFIMHGFFYLRHFKGTVSLAGTVLKTDIKVKMAAYFLKIIISDSELYSLPVILLEDENA